MKEFPKKFLSLRDKNGTHRRNRSGGRNEPNSRPLSSDGVSSVLKSEHGKGKEGAGAQNDPQKLEEVQRRLDELRIADVPSSHIRDILATYFVNGDPRKAAEFIDLEQKAAAGVIVPYDRRIHMLGAENRGAVTCYIDSLLFAMFCKIDAFECMLKEDFPPDDNRSRLVNLLRMWVNLLRTGKLIRTDMTKLIQDALADCGWADARLLEQQDTSEAFAFLTETLQLPLLSLQVDLFHQGRRDDDDHKVVYERLLNLAVPPDPEGRGLALEDCLEEYFNNQVDVQRDSEMSKKSLLEERRPTIGHRQTLQLVTEHPGESSTGITSSPTDLSPRHLNPDENRDVSSPTPTAPTFQSKLAPQGNDSDTTIPAKDDVPTSQCDSHLAPTSEENVSETQVQSKQELEPEKEPKTEEQPEAHPEVQPGVQLEVPPEPNTETESKAEVESKQEPPVDVQSNGHVDAVDEENTPFPSLDTTPVVNKKIEELRTVSDGVPTIAQRRPSVRARSASVIQHIAVDEHGRSSSLDTDAMWAKARRKGSTIVKAVTIPAWQFFRLIPWHAVSSSNEPESDLEVAMNFEKKPVVGICLKRYAMTESGVPKRHNTYIDIPDSLRLPRFMLADEKPGDDPEPLNLDYKLVLQSVICHRGDSVQSGHYISFARVDPKTLTDNRRTDFDPPPDYEEAQWVCFDDLNTESRVTYVDDIRQSLRKEMPYLLFYQVVPMMDEPAPSTAGTENGPPSYTESKASVDLPQTPGGVDSSFLSPTSHGESYFDNSSLEFLQSRQASKPPSIRLSADFDRPERKSTDGQPSVSGTTLRDSELGNYSRQSINFTDSANVSPAMTPYMTPEQRSPAVTAADESTASRLSRAANKFARGRQSRPTSQSGAADNRISSTMNRAIHMMRSGKDHGKDGKEPAKEPSKEPPSKAHTRDPPLAEPTAFSLASVPDLPAHMEHAPVGGARPMSMMALGASAPPKQMQNHRRGKSKEKPLRTNTAAAGGNSDQPERECVVM